VVIYQENHSFDNVFGRLCVALAHCDGAIAGLLPSGVSIPLQTATDVVPRSGHGPNDQLAAINGGLMNGFANVAYCDSSTNFACYSQYQMSQIPNLSKLGLYFTISDRTFELTPTESWLSHLELATADPDGFIGGIPVQGTSGRIGAPGWGCDSYTDIAWFPPSGGGPVTVPSCVPMADGTGPYKPSPVPHVPTIMDRLEDAGVSWKLYTGIPGTGGQYDSYGFAICPTFARCIYTGQSTHMVAATDLFTDAQAGNLPGFSVVTPIGRYSQHNQFSMAMGDNWIGALLLAIYRSPQWSSTAVLITYDDCGCFYDHVPPPPGLGIRVPMVIVGPFVKRFYTDSGVASYASILALTEHAFGLSPLGAADSTAYDYANAFNFAQTRQEFPPITTTPAPVAEQQYIASHLPEPEDPT
jgi:phospholipase C